MTKINPAVDKSHPLSRQKSIVLKTLHLSVFPVKDHLFTF